MFMTFKICSNMSDYCRRRCMTRHSIVLFVSSSSQEKIASTVLDDFQDDFVVDIGPEIKG